MQHKLNKNLTSRLFVEIPRPDSAKDPYFYPSLGLTVGKTSDNRPIERQRTQPRNTVPRKKCSNRRCIKMGTVSGSGNPRK